MWWFEIVDMLVKLVLTSLLVFLPGSARLPVGAAIAGLYLMFTLAVGAFARSLDERMQFLAYGEVLLLFLAGIQLQAVVPAPGSSYDIMMVRFRAVATAPHLLWLIGRVLDRSERADRHHVHLPRSVLRSSLRLSKLTFPCARIQQVCCTARARCCTCRTASSCCASSASGSSARRSPSASTAAAIATRRTSASEPSLARSHVPHLISFDFRCADCTPLRWATK